MIAWLICKLTRHKWVWYQKPGTGAWWGDVYIVPYRRVCVRCWRSK